MDRPMRTPTNKPLGELENPLRTLSPAARKKEENARYRAKLKENACLYKLYKERQAESAKRWRQTLSEEKKAAQREKARLRQIAFRTRQKEQQVAPANVNGCSKPITRAEDKKLEEKRARNKIAQQKRRANMSTQKKRREREKSLARWHSRHNQATSSTPAQPGSVLAVSPAFTAQPLPPVFSPLPVPPASSAQPVQPVSPPSVPPAQELDSPSPQNHSSCESPQFTYPSVTARTSAVHRLKKKISTGGKMLVALKYLVKSVNKKNSQHLQGLGISYLSPTKRRPLQQEPELLNVVSSLKSKRNKDNLMAKSALVTAAQNVLGRYGTKAFLKKARLSSKRSSHPYTRRQDPKGEAVKNFFSQKSHFIPGKRGTTKKLGPRKILDKSVSNLFAEFIKANGTMVSMATFFRKRPKTVLSFLKTPFRQCLCEICLNPLLKMKAMARVCGENVEDVSALVNMTVCGEKMECLRRECDKCGVNGLDELLDKAKSVCTGNVEWMRWEKCEKNGKKRVDLAKKVGSMTELGEELKSETEKLPLHHFTAKWQSGQYRNLYQSLTPEMAIVTMDFAENYTCLQQDQPQSAFFGYSQVTIHPCVVQYMCPNCRACH